MSSQRELKLNEAVKQDGTCVLYVMSRDQRVHDNHALLFAQKQALEKELPLVVVFNLYPSVGVRAQEHYRFMVDGLKELEAEFKKLDIPFFITIGKHTEELQRVIEELDPQSIYFDFSPLSGLRKMQKAIAKAVACSVSVIDAHNIIPLWVLSEKEEYAAHTIRKKVHKNLEDWLTDFDDAQPHPHTGQFKNLGASWNKVDAALDNIEKNSSNIPFPPGVAAAESVLNAFIEERLVNYAEKSNDPNAEALSNLSPYLHFGQISAQRVALEVTNAMSEEPLLFQRAKLASHEGTPTLNDSANAFLEELIVRKELSDNFCFYNENYKSIKGIQDWAKETLTTHEDDEREYTYSLEEWENASIHDDAWNAAQRQMMQTGKMHGYMRMYWAKKILEWSKSPQEAVETAVYLNDRYSLDGGDPNGYTGILWSIGGVHDRPWTEREVYGKIRYMNYNGLKRKFDVESYIEEWS